MHFVPILADAEKDADKLREMLPLLIVVLGIVIIVGILFLLTLQKALSRCSPRNRLMEPGMVWLNLIPCWNIIWQFFTVNRVSGSLQNEFRDRGMREGGDFGAGLGITSCVLRLISFIPIIGPVLAIAGLICGIIYWVKIAGYSSTLALDGHFDDVRRDGWDDDDDRPRGRSSRRDDNDDDDRPDDYYDRGRGRDDDDFDRPSRR